MKHTFNTRHAYVALCILNIYQTYIFVIYEQCVTAILPIYLEILCTFNFACCL